MIYFIVGFFFGGIIEMVLYSVVVSGRINNLEYQNKQMIFELEQKEKELATYRCMYASSYDGFEDTKWMSGGSYCYMFNRIEEEKDDINGSYS